MTHELTTSKCRIRQQRDFPLQFQDEHFEPSYWQGTAGYQDTVGGRGGSCLIDIEGRRVVLRRYRRGGFMRRLFNDQYLWLGQSQTRSWREWEILQRAREAELPTPEPIAACSCRSGPWYRAALITAYLDDTEMMTQRLRRQVLPPDCWHRLGLLIKRMHVAGIRHADLTSDNILVDSADRFYVVDFDKARIMNRIDDWQWQPLHRLQRSLDKRNRLQALHYDAEDWQALMDGYQS